MTTATAITPETLSQKIRSGILKGRAILPKKRSNTAVEPTPAEARATVEKFAGLCESLASVRATMDAKLKLHQEGKSFDLAELLEAGKPLPDFSRLEDESAGAMVHARTNLQVLNRQFRNTQGAINRLSQLKRDSLLEREAAIRSSMEKPEWMNPKDFEIAVLRSPQIFEIRNVGNVHPPQLPIARNEEREWALKVYRVESVETYCLKFQDGLDEWNPLELASQLRSWLAHLDELNITATPGAA